MLSGPPTLTITPDRPCPVRVVTDAVHIDSLIETDADVVAAVTAATDPVAEVHRQLAVGARMLRLASTTVDTQAVRTEVDALTGRLTGTVDEAVTRFTAVAQQLLDEETGALATRNRDLLTQLTSLLGDTFDPARKESAVAGLEHVLNQAGDRNVAQFRALINPDAPDSMFGRFRHEFTRAVTDELDSVRGELRGLAELVATQVAAKAAAEAMYVTGTGKGRDYEAQIHGYLEQCALAHGDLATSTGAELGTAGTKKGDIVLTINREDTGGHPRAVVVEVKDHKLSMLKTMAELDAAMNNREAHVGLAVFASQDAAPTSMPFTWYDGKAILVVDRNDPDPAVVRVAYAWARWMARRDLPGVADRVDPVRVQALLDEARRSLTRRTTVRRAHAAARNKIAEAATEVNALVEEVEAALQSLAEYTKAAPKE